MLLQGKYSAVSSLSRGFIASLELTLEDHLVACGSYRGAESFSNVNAWTFLTGTLAQLVWQGSVSSHLLCYLASHPWEVTPGLSV